MLLLRDLDTIKILPHSNDTASIGKYKRKISLATSRVRGWRDLELQQLLEYRSGVRPFQI